MTGLDVSQRAAQRLERLDNHLAYVVALHLFVENLLNRLIIAVSPLGEDEVTDDPLSMPRLRRPPSRWTRATGACARSITCGT